jgi:hypothetical protein
MMNDAALADVLWLFGFLAFSWLLYRVITFTRKHHFDSRLWGTVFESLSHYVQPQDQLKEPKQEINQIKKVPSEDEENGGRD